MAIRHWVEKVGRKIKIIRLHPIHVFCFHQVSDVFDPDGMWECDWTQIDVFKSNVLALKEKYTFVSLKEAYRHILNDKIRLKHYAVLTADDGWASLKNILPWLAEQQVPVTLFLNPCYFDGCHFRERETEKYLLEVEVKEIVSKYSTVSIGIHGWEHTLATEKDENEFRAEVKRAVECLRSYVNYVPFFAYTWGRHNEMTDRVLEENGLIPVLIDSTKNIDDSFSIHRELIDGKECARFV